MKDYVVHIDEINLHTVCKDILRNFWVIVLICVSAVLCLSASYKLGYHPQYTSTATFAVSTKGSSSAYNSLGMSRDMATVFAEVFQSNILKEKLNEAMGDTPFNGSISTSTIPETNIILVSVTASTPEQAFRALNLVIENYPSISDYLFTNALLNVIKDPSIPTGPSNPLNTDRNRSAVLLIAFCAATGIIITLSVLRDTIQTPRAAKRNLDTRLLRTIHHEVKNKTFKSKLQRKNIAPLITNPLITTRFKENNASLTSAIEYHMRKRSQKVLMVCSAGENEGKSTVAVNIALSLVQQNKKVLLLDCDFRKPSLHKILETEVPTAQTLATYLNTESTELKDHLIYLKKFGLTVGINRTGYKHSYSLTKSQKLSALIENMQQQMDYIILDTPPILAVADAIALAEYADAALMVVRADYMKTATINDCLDMLRQGIPDVIGITLNNYHKTPLQ